MQSAYDKKLSLGISKEELVFNIDTTSNCFSLGFEVYHQVTLVNAGVIVNLRGFR